MKSAVIQAPIQIQWLLTWHMKGAAYKEQEQTYNQYFANRLQLRFEEEKQLNTRNFVLVTNLFGAQSYHVSCSTSQPYWKFSGMPVIDCLSFNRNSSQGIHICAKANF